MNSFISLSYCESSLVKPFSVGSGRYQVPRQDPNLRPSLFPTNQWKARFPGAASRGGWRAKMVGPVRPRFVFFGSSIVEFSFDDGGWGAGLANLYARRADMVLRGYGGWNSRQALRVVKEIFPVDNPIKPALAIVYFGGNDAMIPFPGSPHVPYCEFLDNMTQIALHIKGISETTRCLFLSVPPVNSEQLHEISPGLEKLRPMENCEKYSEGTINICKQLGIKYIDLFNAIQRRPDWKNFFTDGVHFNPKGSEAVEEEILKVLKEAEWVPSLHWQSMPKEYEDIHPIRFNSAKVLLD
ncbi:GDSL esterase/lipase CPRD49-like [Momordica charantia]|uniref:GDSL esterase/lipase CPRD49-like n=1 Tax=Momordica charantia TaxID=3673 RepID=A0A6J1CV48_MOMCH|nr:GDSL esterase/lipase CPRD49-like [Momordica charantia]